MPVRPAYLDVQQQAMRRRQMLAQALLQQQGQQPNMQQAPTLPDIPAQSRPQSPARPKDVAPAPEEPDSASAANPYLTAQVLQRMPTEDSSDDQEVGGGVGGGGGSAGGRGGGPGLPGSYGAADVGATAQERGMNVAAAFMRIGYDPVHAIAMAANALHESGGNPQTKPGDGGISDGLFQWNAGRREAYRRMYGHDPSQGSLDEQVGFMDWELRNTEKGNTRAFFAATDPGSAAAAFSRDVIRPKDVEGSMRARGATAMTLAQRARG